MSRLSVRRLVRSPTALCLVYDDNGIQGASLTLFRSGSSTARLYSISVAGHALGRGIGGALLQASEAAARTRGSTLMRLEVRKSNSGAIALYEKSGFQITGVRTGYYPDGEDAILMQHNLIPKDTSHHE